MGILGWTSKNVDKVIKSYKLRKLFKNQFSDVYIDPNKKYILKVFKSGRGANEEDMYDKEKQYLEKFKENKVLRNNIPRIIEHDDKEKFLLMDHKGRDGIILINDRDYTPQVFDEFLRQLPPLIDEFINNGLVHRDIKPENLVYDSKKHQWSIIDFAFMEPSTNYGNLEFRGTFPYCAPFIGNKHYLQNFLKNNDVKDLKVCADYFSFALAAFSLQGNAHTVDYDNSVTVSLEPVYSTIVNPKSDPALKALAELILSCADVGYSSITWFMKAEKGRHCMFTDVFKCDIFKNRPLEKNVITCWKNFTSIIEKQNAQIINDHVQTEAKYEEDC